MALLAKTACYTRRPELMDTLKDQLRRPARLPRSPFTANNTSRIGLRAGAGFWLQRRVYGNAKSEIIKIIQKYRKGEDSESKNTEDLRK